MITRSGLADGWVLVTLQIPTTDSTLGLSALTRFFGRPDVGKSESVSTACTCLAAPMAKSVSVAVGDRETTHWGVLDAPALGAVVALIIGSATTARDSARVSRRDFIMDISFSAEVVWRRMDIRTTAPYLESCLSHLLAEADLALRSQRDDDGTSDLAAPRCSTAHPALSEH